MANIVPKLNLNKTPSIVENNSLIFAKNIRLDVDTTIHMDYGIKTILDNTNPTLEQFLGKIVGVIADSNAFYLFCYKEDTKKSAICKYDEKEKVVTQCSCNWNWSGGEIDGCVTSNLRGETILTIAECKKYNDDKTFIPLKHINLGKSTSSDDESLYTQTPSIPVTNLNFSHKCEFTIPNGTYQFFVRYKVRDEFYTDWFPASRELFAGNHTLEQTTFGSVNYVNIHIDSSESFVFNVSHLYEETESLYESFQIGFIVSHDDAVYARAWKHFSFDTKTIQFDYNSNDAEEIEVIDLLNVSYQLYNVKNVTSFKNKLYISNYSETNFNKPELQTYADNVAITIGKYKIEEKFDGYAVKFKYFGNKPYIEYLNLNGTDTPIGSFKNPITSEIKQGVLEKVFRFSNQNGSLSYTLESIFSDKKASLFSTSYYGITINLPNCDTFDTIRKTLGNTITIPELFHPNTNNTKPVIKINGTTITYNPTSVIPAGKTAEQVRKENLKLAINAIIDFMYRRFLYIDSNGNIIHNDFTTFPKFDITVLFNYVKPNKSYARQYTLNLHVNTTVYASLDCFNHNGLYDYTTLIPYQKYKFYMHFVTKRGEITNGYYCSNAGEIEVPYQKEADTILYPIFKHIDLPDDYIAYFFTIQHTAVTSGTLFNIEQKGNNTIGNNIELNLNLFQTNKNLRIYQSVQNYTSKSSNIDTITRDNDVSNTEDNLEWFKPDTDGSGNVVTNTVTKAFDGTYHYSGSSDVLNYFGADGIVEVAGKDIIPDTKKENDVTDINLAYIVNDYSTSQYDPKLIKCTPYINTKASLKSYPDGSIINDANYNEPLTLNLCGYICLVNLLDRNFIFSHYSDGTELYEKRIIPAGNPNYGHLTYDTIKLTQLKDDDESTLDSASVPTARLMASRTVSIYSNYNFNYLELTENSIPKIKSYTYHTTTNGEKKKYTSSHIFKLFSSLTLSSIYSFPSMYKEYTRKLYSVYENDIKYIFDNTIRCSLLKGDEANISIFKFLANDYYNVPTNRGIIINLVSVGDAIIVHTQDSMFQFNGSNTITSSQGEIQPTESQPFDTGISEVFGSDFGFAGLQDKRNYIITEVGYIFFDSDSNIIYLYGGSGQLTKLSDSIEKLFRRSKITSVNFANDYYNNRFFVCIKYDDDVTATLSYSLLENVKSFVSLHDFSYNSAFNTKTNCYFKTDDTIKTIDKINLNNYGDLAITTDYIYPCTYNESRYYSIIDVICNTNYEIVKTLNSITWTADEVLSEFTMPKQATNLTDKLADVKLIKNPCAAMVIYTDTTSTDYIPFTDISNNSDLSVGNNDSNNYKVNVDSYKLPRYNQGKWTYNYFRNIQNTEDIWNYLQTANPMQSDMNSLIEGKYIVIRFFFINNFKLETLDINTTNKL